MIFTLISSLVFLVLVYCSAGRKADLIGQIGENVWYKPTACYHEPCILSLNSLWGLRSHQMLTIAVNFWIIRWKLMVEKRNSSRIIFVYKTWRRTKTLEISNVPLFLQKSIALKPWKVSFRQARTLHLYWPTIHYLFWGQLKQNWGRK